MTLWIVHDEPGGQQKAVLARAAAVAPPLWIAVDQEPPDVPLYDLWIGERYEAIAAAAARIAHPNVSGHDLIISTLNGFAGEAQRPVRLEDHSEKTLNLVTRMRQGVDYIPPSQIILAGLSTAYERALARVSGTLGQASVERAIELIGAYAGSALTHLMWDLERSRIPVLASCWDIPQGRKQIPYIPRGVSQVASRMVLASTFDINEWKEVLDANGNLHQAA
jgi:hypothetical protein